MAVSPNHKLTKRLAVRVAAERLTRFYGCYVGQQQSRQKQTQHETQDFHPAFFSHQRHLPP